MIGLAFSLFLVGLPAAMACYLFARPNEHGERTTALGLLAYAVALTLAHMFLLPDGRASLANYQIKMPLALLIGATAGYVTGRIRG